MTSTELISAYRQTTDSNTQDYLTEYFAFKPILQADSDYIDTNLEFRTEVVEALLSEFSLADIQLIRILFHEEMKCEHATKQHNNLYQICFYLYSLGQLKDTFILYDAKFNAQNMDVGLMLDREVMTVGYEVEEVLDYVKREFENDQKLEEMYPTIIEELNGLLKYPDYDSIKDYSKFINGYFYGHKNV